MVLKLLPGHKEECPTRKGDRGHCPDTYGYTDFSSQNLTPALGTVLVHHMYRVLYGGPKDITAPQHLQPSWTPSGL